MLFQKVTRKKKTNKQTNKGLTLFVIKSAKKVSYKGSIPKFHLINNGQTHH